MTDLPPSPSGPLRAISTLAKWSLWLLLAAWLVLALAWGALHGWIVPRIGELRPDIEIEASRVLGVPVRIGGITARTEGLVPSFELVDVVLLDAQGRAALRLPRVVAALSPRSLWNLGFEQLYIDRPELEIRRSADGKIFIAGLDLSRGGDNDGRAADWFFSQTEFVMQKGVVRWTDELRGAPTLALQEVDFVIRNSGRRHAMRLDATPPPQWGERFSLRGLFRQPLLSTRNGQWQEWQGQLHGDFAKVDVSQLRRYVQLGVEVSEGRGALRIWGDVERGQFMGGVADVMLTDVMATLGPRLEPLGLNSVSGRIGGKRLAGGFEFETRGLQFQTREGQHWPGGNLFVTWLEAEGKRPAQGEIRADRLDLQAVSQIATRLPLGTATHVALAAYSPKGLVESVQAKWQGSLSAVQQYEARGRVVGLELAARPAPSASAPGAYTATPGVKGLNVDFELTQAGGKGKFQLKGGTVNLPGVFEEPEIPLDELSADVLWQYKGEALSVNVGSIKFSNADAQGEGQISWHSGDGARGRFPGVLDLQASVSRATAARVYRYLPLGLSKPVRDYVRDSVTQGTASGAKFRVKGNLREFPFKEPRQGEFRISAELKDVGYSFVPARPSGTWPALTQLTGELLFERNGMQLRRTAARFAGAPDLQVRADAQIADLGAATVAVSGDIRGPLAQSVSLVNGAPLSAMMSHALARTSATGNADVRLKLDLPIQALERTRVLGSVTLAGNDIQLMPESPALSRARGVVNFTERGFVLSGAQARALGGDVRIEGSSRVVAPGATDASVTIRAQGNATAEGLRQAQELGFVSRLARDATGGASYSLALALRQGVPEIVVTSNLQGLALNLPPPLAKAAESVLPLRFDSSLVRESLTPAPGAPRRLQDQLTLELGRLASVTYVRDLSAPQPRVIRGSIAVGLVAGESAPAPEQGVMANVNLASLDLDAWARVLSQAAGAHAGTPASNSAADVSAAQAYLPNVMAVRARTLTLEGRSLHNVVVGGSRDGRLWRANLDADELNGYAEYRQPVGSGSGWLHARLARLAIAASAATQVETLFTEQPEVLPALDIVVDDFELKGRKLGRLEIEAVNRGVGPSAREGTAREWRLNKLSLTLPEAVFSATGNWAAIGSQADAAAGSRPAGAGLRTAMKFRLDIADSGELLARFGMKDVVRRGKGSMDGQVAWRGSPLTLNYPTMDGAFHVNMESGQFLKADPGLAKLLGVLSLQSLPRRLALDFRDVFSEGFAFDFMRGDIVIRDGMASTNNLQMKGVNAAVLMDGKADIARETQDLNVVVVPEINAGTASLFATVINPAIGLGTFLAQVFLRQPLMRAATQEFHVDGTWADPRITRVERRLPAQEAQPAQGSN